jgi:hypothetical protein
MTQVDTLLERLLTIDRAGDVAPTAAALRRAA